MGFVNRKTKCIKKNSGPYIHRYDLPGGSLEHGEDLATALRREFREETGYEIEILENIGVKDFKLPWTWKDYNYVHHIAVYYLVRIIGGKIVAPDQFDGLDSLAPCGST
jgi:ADP-ribose pyrophosphatase YjhB (NUDIX family)